MNKQFYFFIIFYSNHSLLKANKLTNCAVKVNAFPACFLFLHSLFFHHRQLKQDAVHTKNDYGEMHEIHLIIYIMSLFGEEKLLRCMNSFFFSQILVWLSQSSEGRNRTRHKIFRVKSARTVDTIQHHVTQESPSSLFLFKLANAQEHALAH